MSRTAAKYSYVLASCRPARPPPTVGPGERGRHLGGRGGDQSPRVSVNGVVVEGMTTTSTHTGRGVLAAGADHAVMWRAKTGKPSAPCSDTTRPAVDRQIDSGAPRLRGDGQVPTIAALEISRTSGRFRIAPTHGVRRAVGGPACGLRWRLGRRCTGVGSCRRRQHT